MSNARNKKRHSLCCTLMVLCLLCACAAAEQPLSPSFDLDTYGFPKGFYLSHLLPTGPGTFLLYGTHYLRDNTYDYQLKTKTMPTGEANTYYINDLIGSGWLEGFLGELDNGLIATIMCDEDGDRKIALISKTGAFIRNIPLPVPSLRIHQVGNGFLLEHISLIVQYEAERTSQGYIDLCYIDFDGNTLWELILPGEQGLSIHCAKPLVDGFLLTGAMATGVLQSNNVVTKLNTKGEIVWQHTLDMAEGHALCDVHISDNGNIAIAGFCTDTLPIPGSYETTTAYSGLFLLLSPDGEVLAQHKYAPDGRDTLYTIILVENGEYQLYGSPFTYAGDAKVCVKTTFSRSGDLLSHETKTLWRDIDISMSSAFFIAGSDGLPYVYGYITPWSDGPISNDASGTRSFLLPYSALEE